MRLSITSLVFTVATLFTLSSCQTLDIRGQYVDDSTVKEIEHKKLNKLEIENALGTPTIIPNYSTDTWYYIQRILAKRAWFDPKVVEQRIVKVKFDKHDTLESVTILIDSQEAINIIGEYTKAHGTELNAAQKFVKNMGRFNKTTDGKKKQRK